MDRGSGEQPATVPTLTHQPALDGIRGAAVLAVVLYHGAGLDGIGWMRSWTHGGFLGVSAFFTLSGFLICSLLLREQMSTGDVALGHFWNRRARRLLPAAYLLLLGVLLLAPIAATERQIADLPGDTLAAVLYVINWRFIVGGTDYAALFTGAPSPLQHLWSLAIEEQWYLIVPLAAVGVAWWRRSRRGGHDRGVALDRFAIAMIAAASLGTIWMIVISGGEYTNRAYMGTDTRFAEMAVGAAAAALLVRGVTNPVGVRRWVNRLAPVALVGVLASWMFVTMRTEALYRGGLTVHAVAVALVIVAAVQSRGTTRRVLSVGALTYIGRISYGVYLIHWPVMLWITPQRTGLPATATLVLQLALTLALASLSFWFIESPIRRGDWLHGARAGAAIAASLALIALAVWWLPTPDTQNLNALGGAKDLVVPTTTTPPATAASAPGVPAAPPTTAPLPPLRVMMAGDSMAESIVIGLQAWAEQTGAMSVKNQSVVGCALGRTGMTRAINVERAFEDRCTERDGALATAVSEFDPQLVVVAGSFFDVADRLPDGFDSWTHIGEPAYDEWLVGELRNLADTATSNGAQLVWLNSPHLDPVPGSTMLMGDPPYPEADPARVDRFNELLNQALDGRPNTTILDLQGWLRQQPGGEFDPSVRTDGVHFTYAGTAIFAPWLGDQLLTAAGRQPAG
jgi:peptidoglycan/LPS O-acetylase OafA/YrhL/lysophospholipase L1-like esterase